MCAALRWEDNKLCLELIVYSFTDKIYKNKTKFVVERKLKDETC